MKLYTIYDSKTESWDQPRAFANAADAIRSFSKAANTEGTMFHDFPTDYSLFEIAEFNPNTGDLVTHEAKRSLGLAIDFKKPVAPPVSAS